MSIRDLAELATATLMQRRLERRVEVLEEQNEHLKNRLKLLEKQVTDILEIQTIQMFQGED